MRFRHFCCCGASGQVVSVTLPTSPNAVEQTFTVRYGGNEYNLTTKFQHETQIVNGTATNTVTVISP